MMRANTLSRLRIRPTLLLLWLVLVACDARPSGPALTAVSPAVVTLGEETLLVVHGHGFLESAHVRLDSTAAARALRTFRVRLGTAFETSDVSRLDSEQLRFTLPADVKQGRYDLTVTTPQGTTLTLPSALSVEPKLVEPVDAGHDDAGDEDAGRVAEPDKLVIETAAGGAGEPVDTTERLRVADSVICHAVLRDASGEFVRDVSATWTVSGAGSDSSSVATQLSLQPRQPGTLRVTASFLEHSRQLTWEVVPGRATQLSLEPDSALVHAGDPAVMFVVRGRDASGNSTDDLGALSWSVSEGDFGSFSEATATLTPERVGVGRIVVHSDYGLAATSGTIQVLPGEPAELTISPQTWRGAVGDDAQRFSAEAHDAYGNLVLELGPLTYAVASGTIAEIDGPSGVFSPRAEGDGTISVSTADGLRAETQNVHVDPLGIPATLSALRGPDTLWPGQRAARFELDITNPGTRDALVSGVALSFVYLGADISGDFVVRPGLLNSDRVSPGSTHTFVYFVDVLGAGTRAGPVTVTAAADLFLPSGYSATGSAATSSTLRANTLGVQVAISQPVLPNTRLCANQTIAFAAATSRGLLPTYLWRFAQAVTSSSATPSAQYLSAGFYPYEVTATDALGLHDTALGSPIFVGELGASPEATYPTGPILLSAPSTGQNVALTSLPRSDLIQSSLTAPVRQCDGSVIAATGHNVLTAYSDRRLLDPRADIDSTRAGIQLALTDSGALPSIALRQPDPAIEGTSTLYFEYVTDSTARVTAAGDVSFQLTQDTKAPYVVESLPARDCTSDCLGPTDAWWFRFSEPMAQASLAGVTVERLHGLACASSAVADLTATSLLRYDALARTLTVIPPAQETSDYTVRVSLRATLTDTAALPNALSPLVRCARVKPRSAAAVPTTPYVSARDPAAFSPDGDGLADSATWTVRVDDQTAWLRLQIRRANRDLWAEVAAVSGAGEYRLSWQGVASDERVVGNGVYRYDVVAFNRAGVSSIARTGFIEVQHAVHLSTVRSRY